MVESRTESRHKALVASEAKRARMVRAMVRRQREWDELVECMQPSCLPYELPSKWEGWHADADERQQYDDETLYHHARTTVQPCRLDWWELAECNRRGIRSLPDSAYEARNLMRYVDDAQ